MSDGFGLPNVGNQFYNMIVGVGDAYRQGVAEHDRRATLSKLGEQIGANDYSGAVRTAFDGGDPAIALKVLGLVGDQRKQQLGEAASREFSSGLTALFGAGGAIPGGSAGAPAGSAQPFKTDDPVADGLQPHQKALLNAIAGPESAGRYNVRFTPRGGALFDGFDRHPGIAEMGPAGPSTAAGRYQFTKSTWDGLGGGNFSPENQDRRALQLAAQDYGARTGRDLDADLQREGFSPRIQQVLAPTWTGLGGNQARNSATYAESLARYGAAGAGQPARVASADFTLPPGASGLNPGRPVQIAETEQDVRRLERGMGMVPAGPQRRQLAGAAPDAADMPERGSVPASFQIPPGGAGQGGAGAVVLPSSSAQAPGPVGLPSGGSNSRATAGLPVDPNARIGAVPVVQVQAAAPGQRLPFLMRAVANPNLDDNARGLASMLLKQTLSETAMPDSVKEYAWARAHGQTQARSPVEYAAEKASATRGPTVVSGGSSIYQDGRFITAPGGREDRDEGEKIRQGFEAREALASRLGYEKGTPAYNAYVGSGKTGSARDLTAGEMKSVEAADTMALGAQQSIKMLESAKELSARAYAGPLAAWRGQVTGALGNQTGQATTELDNLVTTNALAQLKSIFGAAPTEGERKILLDIQGSSNLPHQLRVKIYDRAIQAAELRMQQNEGKADAIREGRYFRQGGGAAVRGNPPRGEDVGAPRGQQPRSADAPVSAAPPAAAIDHLRQNPGLRAAFDAKYGPGSADQALGGR